MRKGLLLIVLLLQYPILFAQQNINFQSIKDKYSKYNAVITNEEYHYVFDIDHDTLMIKQDNLKEVLILNEHSKSFTNDYVYHGAFSSIEDLKAESYIPNGKGYDKLAVKQFNEHDDVDDYALYDDTKEIQFAYPSLMQGAITKLQYSIVYNNPRFVNGVYFQSFVPIMNVKVVVKVHKDIKLGYKIFNAESVNLKQYTKGKYNYYEWEAADVAPYKYFGTRYYGIGYFSPHIILYVEKYKVNGTEHPYYGSIKDLHDFYNTFVSMTNNDASDELKQHVENLTRNLSDVEKAKAIYYWVQNNIKYIAYSDGYSGFVPASPSEVFAKRFGDCKGMTSLIRKMMELANLPAYLSWVGTRRIPYSYSECPLPVVDNHMVTTFFHNDSVIIMDGTFDYLDFGMYPYHIQGKEVMISIDKDNYKIFKVPVSPPSVSKLVDSVNISLVGNTIKGTGVRIQTGFNKVELAMAMDGVKQENFTKMFSKLFSKGNNKFKVDSVSFKDIFEREKPSEVYYEFNISDYVNSLNDEIYINLNLDKSLGDARVDTSIMHSPIVNDFKYSEKHITNFQIPEGYEVKFIPSDDSLSTDFASFSIKYQQQGNRIILEKEIVYNFLIVINDDINKWNSMVDRLNKNYRSTLVLKKKSI